MAIVFVSALIFNLCWVTISAGPIAIQKCHAADSACILKSANAFKSTFIKGIPEYHVPSIETLKLPLVDASSPTLKLIIKDGKVEGVDHCEILDVKRDVDKRKLHVQVMCNVQAYGLYEMKGKLLVLPIEGNGKVSVDIKKMLVNIEADMGQKTGKDNKPHFTINHWSYSYELTEKTKLNFENLFAGNKELAKAAENVISESGNEIIDEIGAPILKAVYGKVVESVAHLLKAVPIEDLSLDN